MHFSTVLAAYAVSHFLGAQASDSLTALKDCTQPCMAKYPAAEMAMLDQLGPDNSRAASFYDAVVWPPFENCIQRCMEGKGLTFEAILDLYSDEAS